MNTPKDPITSEAQPLVNEQRRRLTRGGLAAPVVLGTLLSKPVLGAVAHNCTTSGNASGNVSTHTQGTCSALGAGDITFWLKATPTDCVTFWKSVIPSWSQVISDNNSNTRVFGNTLKVGLKFSAVYQPFDGGNANAVRLFNVLKGNVAGGIAGTTNIELGQEAVVALLNSLHGTYGGNKFPLSPTDVVKMFNDVVNGGNYLVENCTGINCSWNAATVLDYFKSLHS
jgi:hypothetical protein